MEKTCLVKWAAGLVCVVNDDSIQRRLLAESQFEFKKAMELATAVETADGNTRSMLL